MMGLYKSAGVDLVRQQIEAQFPPPLPWYDVSAAGLVLWPDGDEDVEVLYDLARRPVDRPAVGPRIGAAVVADRPKATTHLRRGAGALGRLGGGLEPGRGRPGAPAGIPRPGARIAVVAPWQQVGQTFLICPEVG